MRSFEVTAMVLAAGEAAGMRSSRPRPLHRVCGQPLLAYTLDALARVGVEHVVVVVGDGGDQVAKQVAAESPAGVFVEVVDGRGAGGSAGAALTGLESLSSEELDDENARMLVVPADRPLLPPELLSDLIEADGAGAVAIGSGPGRFSVLRGRDGKITDVVDGSPSGDGPSEFDAGVYCFRREVLMPALRRLIPFEGMPSRARLAEVVAVLDRAGYRIVGVEVSDQEAIRAVGDRLDLAQVERELRRRTNERWMRQGVTFVDPDATYVDTTVRLATDVTLFPDVVLQGDTAVGEGTEIGPGTRLVDSVIGAHCRIEKVVATGAEVADEAVVGPFVVLGEGAQVGRGERMGPFSERRAEPPGPCR